MRGWLHPILDPHYNQKMKIESEGKSKFNFHFLKIAHLYVDYYHCQHAIKQFQEWRRLFDRMLGKIPQHIKCTITHFWVIEKVILHFNYYCYCNLEGV